MSASASDVTALLRTDALIHGSSVQLRDYCRSAIRTAHESTPPDFAKALFPLAVYGANPISRYFGARRVASAMLEEATDYYLSDQLGRHRARCLAQAAASIVNHTTSEHDLIHDAYNLGLWASMQVLSTSLVFAPVAPTPSLRQVFVDGGASLERIASSFRAGCSANGNQVLTDAMAIDLMSMLARGKPSNFSTPPPLAR